MKLSKKDMILVALARGMKEKAAIEWIKKEYQTSINVNYFQMIKSCVDNWDNKKNKVFFARKAIDKGFSSEKGINWIKNKYNIKICQSYYNMIKIFNDTIENITSLVLVSRIKEINEKNLSKKDGLEWLRGQGFINLDQNFYDFHYGIEQKTKNIKHNLKKRDFVIMAKQKGIINAIEAIHWINETFGIKVSINYWYFIKKMAS